MKYYRIVLRLEDGRCEWYTVKAKNADNAIRQAKRDLNKIEMVGVAHISCMEAVMIG